MILLKGSALPYIPFEAEHNWFDIKPSQLTNSGMGLYARYRILDHVTFSEYKGKIRDFDKGGDVEVYPYAVSVLMEDGTLKMIDGLDEDLTTVLSFAPRCNDAGPKYANCILAEYKEHPGRVFLESTREIKEGEEIFVCYGASYWNIKNYPNFPELKMYGQLPSYSKSSCKGSSGDIETNIDALDYDDLESESTIPSIENSPKKNTPTKKRPSSSSSSSLTTSKTTSSSTTSKISTTMSSITVNSTKKSLYTCATTKGGLKIVLKRIK